nr:M20/M25/M40 family metallo-hydrolase [uncultured Pedobacter sp.]
MIDFLKYWDSKNEKKYTQLLLDYIAIDTTSPKENDAWPFLNKNLVEHGFSVRKEFISDKIWDHPYHCSSLISKVSNESYNIVGTKITAPNLPTVLINCHVDVVPLSPKFETGFSPKIENGHIIGRGACDTKGNLIILFAAIDYLKTIGKDLTKNILLHLPIEEEIGGNGTLSLVLNQKEKVDYALIFEPTNFQIFRGHRGCLTFDIEIQGSPVHMGQAEKGVSAIDVAFELIQQLKILENDLLIAARNNIDFAIWEKPIQLNIGMIKGGEWHGSVPENCRITGNLGFLPDKKIEDVGQIISKITNEVVEKFSAKGIVMFNALKNDAYIMPENQLIISEMAKACLKSGINQNSYYGWNVSCDARLYFKELNIPTIIFGCGLLKDAHSNYEKLEISELTRGIRILSSFLCS